MIQQFLHKLSQELSIPPPKLLEKKKFSFSLNPEIVVNVRDLDPGLSLQAFLIQCPEKKREELFMHLMQANLLGQGTAGSRIGMNFEEKTLTLLLGLPYEINYQLFRETFEDFVNHLIFWRNEIEKLQNEKTFY